MGDSSGREVRPSSCSVSCYLNSTEYWVVVHLSNDFKSHDAAWFTGRVEERHWGRGVRADSGTGKVSDSIHAS